MKKVTNQQVYDALTHCIEKKWKPHASRKGGVSMKVEGCALCKLFDGGVLFGKSVKECKPCPIFILNNGSGCGDGSAFNSWVRTPQSLTKQAKAKSMLAELETAKAHFFGDWKPWTTS